MSVDSINELASSLTPAEREMLTQPHCQTILSTASGLAMSPGSGPEIALRYLQTSLAPLLLQVAVGKATPRPRNPLSGPRRGIFRMKEIEGVKIQGVQLGKEWRCVIHRLSKEVHPEGRQNWLNDHINRDSAYVKALKGEGFAGVREQITAARQTDDRTSKSPTFATLCLADTEIVLKHRDLINV